MRMPSLIFVCSVSCFLFFFFNDTATTEIYTLSLHDALPIYSHSARPLQSVRQDVHVPAAFLPTLYPLQRRRSQSSAAAPLCGRLQLGGRGARYQRSPAFDRSVHAAPMVPQSGCLSAAVFVFAFHDTRCLSGVGCRQTSPLGWLAAVLANSIPLFRSVLALTALKKLSHPPSSPGNTASVLLCLTWEGKNTPWARIWNGSNSVFRCWNTCSGTTGPPALPVLRKSLLGCVHYIGKAALPSTSMPARICSTVTDVGAAEI